MKKLRNLLMVSVLAMLCILGTKYNVNAKTRSINPLKINKTYKYNLDQKGAKEKVKVVREEDEDEDIYMTLYINDKAVVSNVYYGTAFVIDANKKDKQMEIIVAGGVEASKLERITYYRYRGGKLKKIQNLENLIRKKYAAKYEAINKGGDVA